MTYDSSLTSTSAIPKFILKSSEKLTTFTSTEAEGLITSRNSSLTLL
jgi:hypothetical protein